MIARLHSIWLSIKASYWFYPALFALIGFLLGMGLVYLDRIGATGWLQYVRGYHPASPEGASNMLTVISGSMIGVASTVFSITIAAVAYASGTYGPRLLTNFMEDKGNQLSLAAFIGTFVYAITVLRAVRAVDETALAAAESAGAAGAVSGFVPQLALLVAFVLMMLSVGVLVYFLHHIPSSIRINAVLADIGQRLLKTVSRHFPERQDVEDSEQQQPVGRHVMSSGTGYVRVIELSEMSDLAEKHELRIALLVRTGDFVFPGTKLVSVNTDRLDEDVAGNIEACFALGRSRTPQQDIEFSIDELVEIALRALSPGINDPFTAITAVHWLGAATAEIGQRQLCPATAEQGKLARVMLRNDGFDHFVTRGFGAMRSAVATSRIAALVAFNTLARTAAQIEDKDRRALLAREGDLLMEQAERALSGPDLEDLRGGYAEFRKSLRQ